MGTNSADFNQVVEGLESQLQKALEGRSDKEEWLRSFYQLYTQRFLSDNNHIWTTGAIMIPASLAGFAVVAGANNITIGPIVVLGIASTLLMFSWVVIGENHRAFQNKSLAWIKAIEKVVGINDTFCPKILDEGSVGFVVKSGMVQEMRWGLLLLVFLGWVVDCFLVL